MLKHKYLLFLFLASLILLTYTMSSYAKDCFSGVEAKQVEIDLKDSWWTTKEQQKLDINYFSSHLIPENSSECIVLIESREKNYDCHACTAELGIALYSKSGNEWKKTFEQKNVGEYGDYGKLPKATLVKVGQNNYGIILHATSMQQGHYSKSNILVAKVNKKYKEVIRITTSAGGPNSVYPIEAQYEFIEGESKQFFDIKVVSKNTKENWKDGKMEITTVKETKFYKFVHDKYVLVEDKSDTESYTRAESEEDFIEKVQETFVPVKKNIRIKGDKESYFKIFGTLVENNPRLLFEVNQGKFYETISIPLEKVTFRFIKGAGEPKMRIIVGEVSDKCIRLFKTNKISFIEDNICVKGINV
ncbi:MAG: hypothetical protein IH964_10705, partial [Candidatus Dadabacteria bacterium]|nr:hypothetical protein [Candidatus Dadabacteria bacterium]